MSSAQGKLEKTKASRISNPLKPIRFQFCFTHYRVPLNKWPAVLLPLHALHHSPMELDRAGQLHTHPKGCLLYSSSPLKTQIIRTTQLFTELSPCITCRPEVVLGAVNGAVCDQRVGEGRCTWGHPTGTSPRTLLLQVQQQTLPRLQHIFSFLPNSLYKRWFLAE